MCYCVLYLGYEVLELTCDGPVVLDAHIIFTYYYILCLGYEVFVWHDFIPQLDITG